jgi:hypothetical protein
MLSFFRGHKWRVARRFAALLTLVLGLGVWTALRVAGHDAVPRPQKSTWGLGRSSIGEYGSFQERTRTKPTPPSASSPCARGENDGGGCGDPTGMPEPMTLLLSGAMLAGLGVVVRRGLRGRAGSSGS